ncbi:hypothetical protein A3Q56_04961 [Intoshia linei]|uniref:C2H2-type domain-containing protein n=1 Tax=Intoshia linei TaxID=1819745 RepID=A0A177AZ09_9BILA|nr:hypothetical protein A3Q56_04961 [Intoshia linei]
MSTEVSDKLDIYSCFLCSLNSQFNKKQWIKHFKSAHTFVEKVENNGQTEDCLFSLCPQCSRKFKLGSNILYSHCIWYILNHLISIHNFPTPPYVNVLNCDQCEFSTIIQTVIQSHKDSHDKKKMPCKFCGKKLAKSSLYLHHRNCKFNENYCERVFKCDKCSQLFNSRKFLTCHSISKHNDFTKCLQCTICHCEYYSNIDLERHLFSKHKINISDKIVYNCDDCKYSTIDKSLLIRHGKIHNVENIKCSFCNKLFSNSARYQNHRRTHLSLKNFKCNLCGYSTSRDFLLKRHKKSCCIHYSCKLCDYNSSNIKCMNHHFSNRHSDVEMKLDTKTYQIQSPDTSSNVEYSDSIWSTFFLNDETNN